MSSGVVIYHRLCVCGVLFFNPREWSSRSQYETRPRASLLAVERKVAWKRKTNGSLLSTGELIWRRLWCCVHSLGPLCDRRTASVIYSRLKGGKRAAWLMHFDTWMGYGIIILSKCAGPCTGSHSNLCALPSEMRLQIPCCGKPFKSFTVMRAAAL